MRCIALVGMPASGKSAIVRGVLDLFPLPWRYGLLNGHAGGRLWLVGRYDADQTFPGTDRLSFRASRDLLAWLALGGADDTVVWEGDRFAMPAVLHAVDAMPGVSLQVIVVDTQDTTRQLRARLRQSTQSPAWIKSRATKLARITTEFPHAWRWVNDTPVDLAHHQTQLRALLTAQEVSQ